MQQAGASAAEEIFLFVNPKSGGNTGELFLQIPQPFLVRLHNGSHAHLRVFSLLDGPSGNMPGFHELTKHLAALDDRLKTSASHQALPHNLSHHHHRHHDDGRGRPVKVIVGGGDGTIMWVVSEAEKHGIDVGRRLHIGIVPLGTGNDFSRAAGWGGQNPPRTMLEDGCRYVNDLVQHWSTGLPDWHDVWRVRLEVDDDRGRIVKISKKEEKVLDQKEIDSPMLNYMSIGQDSEAGFDFEKNRRASQCGNIMQYACSGVKVATEFDSTTVKEAVRGMYHGEGEEGTPIFLTDDDERAERGGSRLRKDPHILLVLNIKSYAGGSAPRLWNASILRYGCEPPCDDMLLERPSHPGDGKLDVLTLRYAARVLTGNLIGGRRVFWGAPLYFDFHEYEDADLVTFFNIDGEFYKVINPTSLSIVHGGKLQVLHSAESMAHVHKVHPKHVEPDSESDDGGSADDALDEHAPPQFSWCCALPAS